MIYIQLQNFNIKLPHDTNDSQYPKKHAITKVINMQGFRIFSLKGKPRFHQFFAKDKIINIDLKLKKINI